MPFGHCLWQPYDESEREGFLRVLERIEDLKEISPSLQREQTYSTVNPSTCQPPDIDNWRYVPYNECKNIDN